MRGVTFEILICPRCDDNGLVAPNVARVWLVYCFARGASQVVVMRCWDGRCFHRRCCPCRALFRSQSIPLAAQSVSCSSVRPAVSRDEKPLPGHGLGSKNEFEGHGRCASGGVVATQKCIAREHVGSRDPKMVMARVEDREPSADGLSYGSRGIAAPVIKTQHGLCAHCRAERQAPSSVRAGCRFSGSGCAAFHAAAKSPSVFPDGLWWYSSFVVESTAAAAVAHGLHEFALRF